MKVTWIWLVVALLTITSLPGVQAKGKKDDEEETERPTAAPSEPPTVYSTLSPTTSPKLDFDSGSKKDDAAEKDEQEVTPEPTSNVKEDKGFIIGISFAGGFGAVAIVGLLVKSFFKRRAKLRAPKEGSGATLKRKPSKGKGGNRQVAHSPYAGNDVETASKSPSMASSNFSSSSHMQEAYDERERSFSDDGRSSVSSGFSAIVSPLRMIPLARSGPFSRGSANSPRDSNARSIFSTGSSLASSRWTLGSSTISMQQRSTLSSKTMKEML